MVQHPSQTPARMILSIAGPRPSPSRTAALPSRLFARICLLFHITALLEGASSSPRDEPDQGDPPTPEFDQLFPADPTALCNLLHELTHHLRSRLPAREWLEEGAIKFVGDHPVGAGEVANIFIGMRGNRKVVVKCYRFYPSVDYLPTYMVRELGDHGYILLTETPPVEVP